MQAGRKMDEIRIGVLGLAHGHVFAYLNQWKERPELGMKAVAGWDHDAERAKTSCEANGMEVMDSAEALLARDDIDAVHISAETAYHADMVEMAAAAGKMISLQKPMALEMDQADRIVAAVEKAGVPFTMAWQMRVDPHNVKAKELVQSGEFGRVWMIRRRHCLTTQAMGNFETTWHVDPAMNRDIFADDASHPMDFIYWMMGMPVSVSCEMTTLLNPKIPNDNGIALFRYADGRIGEVSSTFVEVGGENNLEIHCENGCIIGNYGDGPSSGIPRPEGAIQFKYYLAKDGKWTVPDVPEVPNQGARIAGLAEPLSDFFHGKRGPIASAREGRDVLRMMLACYESNQQGKRVYF